MEMVEGGTRAEVASVLSEKLPEETGRGALSGRDSGSTFSASPFIHAPSGEARHRSGVGYRVEPRWADVHAGQVFDVDAGLGDDVGHPRTPPSLGPRVGFAPFPSVLLTLCSPLTRRSISSGIV